MEISSITKGPRQSNMELLRIVAMFLVLVVHTAFMTTGAPSKEEIINSFIPSITKISFESLSIICVNVFILISGWFGIKPSVRGFCNFLFQCLYFLLGIYIVLLIVGIADFSPRTLASCLCLCDANWFILAYTGLYLVSPILNAFVEKVSQKNFKRFLILFYVFQTVWGWSGAAVYIENGYSTFSFIGLYLLARYMHLYKVGKLYYWGGSIYVISVVLNILCYIVTKLIGISVPIFSYANPIVICGAVGLLLCFDNIQIQSNRVVNWIAKSAFAVFLLHTNPVVLCPLFQKGILIIYDSFSGLTLLAYLLTVLVIIYIIAIIVDQPRQILWHHISRRIKQM